MYTEPTWITLIINGTILNGGAVLLSLMIALLVGYLVWKLFIRYQVKKFDRDPEYFDNEDKMLITIAPIAITLLIMLTVTGLFTGMIWNEWMEQPSVRTDTITITGIQPRPGAVVITSEGYAIDNANQLMFTTSDGREFANTENWMFNKFETRTIFNQLRIGGTYKIKYYGWRNGQNNEFPNILSIEEVIDETNTTSNDYNKYFGAHRGQRIYDLSMEEEL